MRILIAEDDNASRELLRRMLQSDRRFDLALAADGLEAWKILDNPDQTVDVCILDIQMPGLDGLELTSRLRSSRRLGRMPVILCTASKDRATVQRAAGLAVAGYIVKPYTREHVLEKIGQLKLDRPADAEPPALEDRVTVCRRLGIDGEALGGLLQAAVADLREWISVARTSGEGPARAELTNRAKGLRGTCLSLGAIPAARLLGAALGGPDAEILKSLEHELERLA